MVVAIDLLLKRGNSVEVEQFYLLTCFIKNKVTEGKKKKNLTTKVFPQLIKYPGGLAYFLL